MFEMYGTAQGCPAAPFEGSAGVHYVNVWLRDSMGHQEPIQDGFLRSGLGAVEPRREVQVFSRFGDDSAAIAEGCFENMFHCTYLVRVLGLLSSPDFGSDLCLDKVGVGNMRFTDHL